MGKGKKPALNSAKRLSPTEEGDPDVTESWSDPNSLSCADSAEHLSTFVDSHTLEENKAIKSSSEAMDTTIAKVAKKLKDAETHFRESGGSSETVVLNSVEAISLYHAEAANYCRLKHAEKNVTILTETLKHRNETIDNMIKLNITFQKKVEDLMGVTTAKTFYVLEGALNGKRTEATEIAAMKVQCNLQTHKLELLEQELELIRALNCGAHKELETLREHVHSLETPKCHEQCQKGATAKAKNDNYLWRDIADQIDAKKRALLKSLKALVQSGIDYQILKGTQDWALLELLFDYVGQRNSKDLVQFCRQVYGSTMEIMPARGESEGSFRVCLSKIKSETGPEIRKELPAEDLERVENFFLNSRMLNCLPALTNSANTADIDHIECLHELARAKEAEAKLLKEEINSFRRLQDLTMAEAKKWRELHDLHLSTCKKQANRADCVVNAINNLAMKFCQGVNLALLSEKEKLSRISSAFDTIVRERDDALRKIDPLAKKLLQKDKSLDENQTELTHALDANRAQEATLKQKITGLEKAISEKDSDAQKARTEVEKWQKKWQKGCDKISDLEKKLQAINDEHNIVKLDHGATQTQLEKERAEARAFKEQVASQISDFEGLRKERDQNRSALLSLRTNKQVDGDMMKKAIRDAVAPKDAEIVQLKAALKILQDDRVADAKTIHELSHAKDENETMALMLEEEKARSAQLEADLRGARDLADEFGF